MVFGKSEMMQMAEGTAIVLPMVVMTRRMLVDQRLISCGVAADGRERIEKLHRRERGSRRQKLHPNAQEADAERRKITDARESMRRRFERRCEASPFPHRKRER